MKFEIFTHLQVMSKQLICFKNMRIINQKRFCNCLVVDKRSNKFGRVLDRYQELSEKYWYGSLSADLIQVCSYVSFIFIFIYIHKSMNFQKKCCNCPVVVGNWDRFNFVQFGKSYCVFPYIRAAYCK